MMLFTFKYDIHLENMVKALASTNHDQTCTITTTTFMKIASVVYVLISIGK